MLLTPISDWQRSALHCLCWIQPSKCIWCLVTLTVGGLTALVSSAPNDLADAEVALMFGFPVFRTKEYRSHFTHLRVVLLTWIALTYSASSLINNISMWAVNLANRATLWPGFYNESGFFGAFVLVCMWHFKPLVVCDIHHHSSFSSAILETSTQQYKVRLLWAFVVMHADG